MSTEIIQTLDDGLAHYRQTTPLDGVIYVLNFDYNSRDQNWYLSVHDSEDQPIEGCVGRKLVTNWPVLFRSTDPNKPPGEIIVVSVSTSEDPGLTDLGNDIILSYVPAEDLAVPVP